VFFNTAVYLTKWREKGVAIEILWRQPWATLVKGLLMGLSVTLKRTFDFRECWGTLEKVRGNMANLKNRAVGRIDGHAGRCTSLLQICDYKSETLLPKPKRTPAGSLLKRDADVERGNFTLRSKGMGFSFREFSELMALGVDPEPSICGNVKLVVERKLAAIEEKFLELQKMKVALQQLTDGSVVGGESAVHCSILDKFAVEKSD
jgi:MerR family Zn(II)-responsive transcriptional regulator of zntA